MCYYYKQKVAVFTSVPNEAQKKTTAAAIAQLNKGGRKKRKKILISLALKGLRHKTESVL